MADSNMQFIHLLQRLKSQKGAVALEAILSILLMLGAFYVMWGASLIVYNQSKIITASQFSAQDSLLVYDRSTYRGGYPVPGDGGDCGFNCSSGFCPGTPAFLAINDSGGALCKAAQAAQSMLNENGGVGTALDQFTGAPPTLTLTNFQVLCGSSITGSASGSAVNCTHTPLGQCGAQVTYVSVTGQGGGTYWLLSPLTEGDSRHASDQKFGSLSASASAISVGPGVSTC